MCTSLTLNPLPAASYLPFSDQTGLRRMIQCFRPQYHSPWVSYWPKAWVSEPGLTAKIFLPSWWRVLLILPPQIMNTGGFSGSRTSWSNSKPPHIKPHENTELQSLKGHHLFLAQHCQHWHLWHLAQLIAYKTELCHNTDITLSTLTWDTTLTSHKTENWHLSKLTPTTGKY